MKKWMFTIVLILILGASIYSVKQYEKNTINKMQSNNNITNIPQATKTSEPSTETAKDSPILINPNSMKVSALDFKLKDLNGKEVSLSQLKGKRVFLNFWATWCPPCKAEMPEIEALYNETKDSDLVILAVNIGESQNTVKSFMDKNKYNFSVLLDTDNSIAAKYNIQSIPTSFFIDKDGVIVSRHIGSMNKTQMETYIKNIDKK
jgi:thiol-disulfide isomerase/thioredoxin